MSPLMKLILFFTEFNLSDLPLELLSNTKTLQLLFTKYLVIADPMKPLPPVIRTDSFKFFFS